MTFLQWLVLINPKGFSSVNSKWFVLAKLVVLVLLCLIIWLFQVCWDLQISIWQVCLHSLVSTSYMSQFMTALRLLRSKELLCLLFCSGSCWYVDFDTVLTVDPFANLKLFLIRIHCSLFIFLVTWFRARTRVRWVAPVRSVCFVRID